MTGSAACIIEVGDSAGIAASEAVVGSSSSLSHGIRGRESVSKCKLTSAVSSETSDVGSTLAGQITFSSKMTSRRM